MNRLISLLKRIQLKQILTVFLAGVLVFVSTACGGSKVVAANSKDVRPDVPGSAVSNPLEGGMNTYSDVDPRANTREAQAKARGLIENAENQVIDQTSNVGENTKRILGKKGENARDFGENVKETTSRLSNTAQRNTDRVSNKTDDYLENTAENAKDAPGYLSETAQKTAPGAAEAVKSGANKTGRAFERAADKLDD